MIIRTIFTLKRISPDYPFKSNQKQAKCWCLCGVCVCCDRGEKQQFVVNFRVSSQNFMRDEGGRMKKTLPCTLYSVMILHLWHPSYCCIHKQKESSGGIHSLLSLKYLESNNYNVHFTITSLCPTNVCRCISPLHLHWPVRLSSPY